MTKIQMCIIPELSGYRVVMKTIGEQAVETETLIGRFSTVDKVMEACKIEILHTEIRDAKFIRDELF